MQVKLQTYIPYNYKRKNSLFSYYVLLIPQSSNPQIVQFFYLTWFHSSVYKGFPDSKNCR